MAIIPSLKDNQGWFSGLADPAVNTETKAAASLIQVHLKTKEWRRWKDGGREDGTWAGMETREGEERREEGIEDRNEGCVSGVPQCEWRQWLLFAKWLQFPRLLSVKVVTWIKSVGSVSRHVTPWLLKSLLIHLKLDLNQPVVPPSKGHMDTVHCVTRDNERDQTSFLYDFGEL